ncbi:hypothetical protein [Massilia sp. YMA4]|uniref:hypothetical protein n=1 Tax=Massilia sp. YMA4 TaxID=1593482 RepID=UPI000DD13F12|nr:hypothetical protein [Massilia sp. YMA4]AXA94157.1 hypothetical protein DPH57_25310 [Massilia sp. YMA4]
MTGWERDAGDPDFNFRNDLARWHDFSATDLSLSDDFDLDLRVRATAGDYGKVWHALVPKFKSVHHTASQSPPSGRSSTTASPDTIHTSIGSRPAPLPAPARGMRVDLAMDILQRTRLALAQQLARNIVLHRRDRSRASHASG